MALLKKGDWHEQGSVTDRYHDRSGKPDKRSDKKLGRNSLKRQLSDARQLGCVFQDMTPPKSILRKSTDMPKTIQRVKFKKAIVRHSKIRDQNPSLGYICPGELHERSPNAPKFEDRSQEETEWQEQGAREAAWKLAKNVLKLKEHQRATFFSSPENRCHLASTLKPEEREFVQIEDNGKKNYRAEFTNEEFEARNGNYETSAVVKNQGTKQREQRSLGDCWQWKANEQCSKGDNCSFRLDKDKRAKSTQPNPSPRSSTQQDVINASRTKSPRGRSPSGKMAQLPCKDYLKGTCTNPFCEKWHPPECLFYKSKNGCRFGEKCSYAHRQVDEQPSKEV